MISLIRPKFPDADEIGSWLSGAYQSGVWSNFGPVHNHCVEELRRWVGGYPVLASSGYSALELLASMQKPGTILVPDFTHAGSILPFMNAGFDVWVVACDPKTMAMDLQTLRFVLENEDHISAVLVVNPFGRGIDRAAYEELGKRHGVNMIFDYAGAWGDFHPSSNYPTMYSFHATKSLPIGEGGLIATNDRLLAETLRRLSNFGTMPNRMIRFPGGRNVKLSEVSCAVLAAQLEKEQHDRILKRLAHRRHLQRIYSSAVQEDLGAIDTIHMNLSLCVVRLPEGCDVKKFERAAEMRGWQALQYYIPMHTMPAFSHLPFVGNRCPALSRCVALPSDVTIDQAQVIADDVREIIQGQLSSIST